MVVTCFVTLACVFKNHTLFSWGWSACFPLGRTPRRETLSQLALVSWAQAFHHWPRPSGLWGSTAFTAWGQEFLKQWARGK